MLKIHWPKLRDLMICLLKTWRITKKFFTLLPNNANLNKEVLRTFAEEIYNSLRGDVAK